MGRAIVKQPNGKLAVFSTIVDDFILMDADWDEYTAMRIEEEAKKILREVKDAKQLVETRGTTSMRGRTWQDYLDNVEMQHGAETAKHRRETGEAT